MRGKIFTFTNILAIFIFRNIYDYINLTIYMTEMSNPYKIGKYTRNEFTFENKLKN